MTHFFVKLVFAAPASFFSVGWPSQVFVAACLRVLQLACMVGYRQRHRRGRVRLLSLWKRFDGAAFSSAPARNPNEEGPWQTR